MMANDIFGISAEDHRRVEGIIEAVKKTNDNAGLPSSALCDERRELARSSVRP